MKKSNKKYNVENIYLWFFCAITLCFFVFRLIRGADITDESFYGTLAYRLVKGNHILRDMWEQCSTSSVLPATLLQLFTWIFGTEGESLILFFRISFFLLNCGAALILFRAQKNYLNRNYAILLAFFYLIYAPFHIYTFSYNNLSDMLITLVVSVILLGVEKDNMKLFFAGGCLCAFLAFTYPTMLILCPCMVALLFLQRKTIKKGWFFFVIGGLSFACCILLLLFISIGMDGIIIGIKGILSDPAYNLESIAITEKFKQAFSYLFTPISEDGIWIKLYVVWLFIVGFFMKEKPVLKLSLGFYPVILCMAIIPEMDQIRTMGTGRFIFYMSILCPFLIFFTEKHTSIFKKFFWFEWLPAMLFYTVLSVSSFGGGYRRFRDLS